MMALECDGLTVRYGDFVAVDGVSLSVQPGEIYGLLGPNGAGKTTVIRALTTIVPIASGTATVAGHPLGDTAAVRSRIGVLPESTGYPNSRTAPAYLTFYGQLFGLTRTDAEARAVRLLGQFGLGDRRRQRIATYSRGMRQRLGICRALMSDPVVLFLDEPTLGLDPSGKDDVLHHLARIAIDDHTCVILCSHLLDEVERACDRIGILHRGRSVAEGTVDQVVDVAGVTGYGTVRVAPDDAGAAVAVLQRSPAVAAITFDNSRPGDLRLELGTTPDPRLEILRCLLDARIEPRSFDLQGARLSDAFRALTATVAPS